MTFECNEYDVIQSLDLEKKKIKVYRLAHTLQKATLLE